MNAPLKKNMPSMPGPCPVIETTRLTLRPHRMSDAEAIVESLGEVVASPDEAREILSIETRQAAYAA